MNSSRFAGRTAVVTGGASGIGKASARRFLDEGANVVVGDLNADNGSALLAEWSADRARLRFLAGSVAEEAHVEALVGLATSTWGGLDVMFANAHNTTRMALTGVISATGCAAVGEPIQAIEMNVVPSIGVGMAKQDPECVACHTTAFGQPGGFGQPTAEALWTWKGVQCEACHGPMKAHGEWHRAHAGEAEPSARRFTRDALSSTNLSLRLDLLQRTRYLADLGIEKKFEESLKKQLEDAGAKVEVK